MHCSEVNFPYCPFNCPLNRLKVKENMFRLVVSFYAHFPPNLFWHIQHLWKLFNRAACVINSSCQDELNQTHVSLIKTGSCEEKRRPDLFLHFLLFCCMIITSWRSKVTSALPSVSPVVRSWFGLEFLLTNVVVRTSCHVNSNCRRAH